MVGMDRLSVPATFFGCALSTATLITDRAAFPIDIEARRTAVRTLSSAALVTLSTLAASAVGAATSPKRYWMGRRNGPVNTDTITAMTRTVRTVSSGSR